MDKSEDQFQELIANLIARVNRALEAQDNLPSIGLLLSSDNEIEVIVANLEETDLRAEVELIQNSLQEKSREPGSVAALLCYPEYEQGQVVALLENNENFCSKVVIPVLSDPKLMLDVENLTIEDGVIFVFGEADG